MRNTRSKRCMSHALPWGQRSGEDERELARPIGPDLQFWGEFNEAVRWQRGQLLRLDLVQPAAVDTPTRCLSANPRSPT